MKDEIEFGVEVSAFLESPIGKYLINRAEMEINEAVESLKRVNPGDTERIKELQNVIYRAESIQYWLADVLQMAYNAQRELVETYSNE